MRITIRDQIDRNPELFDFELVERKGLGHPDTICDSISERVSRAYSQFCLAEFGRVAHHWFDKVLLIGGEADVRYGRGIVTQPYRVIIAGKCAFSVGRTRIPVEDIAETAAMDVLSEVLTGFRPEHARVEFAAVDSTGPGRSSQRYRPRSKSDLDEFDNSEAKSNDGNLLAGFGPFTRLEQAVLITEQLLNSKTYKALHQDIGSDIKIFGTRLQQAFRLDVNVPLLARDIQNWGQYEARLAETAADIDAMLLKSMGFEIELRLNPADEGSRPYLVALGSVADTGDVGVTGRGNRLNGLITPMRPMSIEAPAGKNPIDHTGKLYGLLTSRLAGKLSLELGGPVEIFVHTAKGTPTDAPDDVTIYTAGKLTDEDHERLQKSVISAFRTIPALSRELVVDGVDLW